MAPLQEAEKAKAAIRVARHKVGVGVWVWVWAGLCVFRGGGRETGGRGGCFVLK